MDDPFAPSTDPDIPTPTRDDLLRLLRSGTERSLLAAGKLESGRSETLLLAARRQWDERHKRAAARRAKEEGKAIIGLPLVGGEPEEVPRDDSAFSGTFDDIKPLDDTTTGARVPGQMAAPNSWAHRITSLFRFLSPVKAALENIVGWEGFSFVFFLPLGLWLVDKKKFEAAQVFLILAALALLLKGVLASQRYLPQGLWRWGGRVASFSVAAIFLWGMSAWVAGEKSEHLKSIGQPAPAVLQSPVQSVASSSSSSALPIPTTTPQTPSVSVSPSSAAPTPLKQTSVAEPTQTPDATVSTQPPTPRISQVASVFPSVRESLPYGFRIVLQTTVAISPVQVFVQCSGPVEEATATITGASSMVGGGGTGAPRGRNYYSVRIDAPPFTPQNPIQIDLFSKEKVTCRVTRVD